MRWARRFVIVTFGAAWVLVFIGLIPSVLDGPTVSGYRDGRLGASASSNVGSLITLLIIGPLAAYWAIRTWNHPRDVTEAPPRPRKRARRRRRT